MTTTRAATMLGLTALLLVLASTTYAVAQKTTAPPNSASDTGKTPEDSSCGQLRTQALRDAVDPNQADKQEWNLRAADAYQQLSLQGASC